MRSLILCSLVAAVYCTPISLTEHQKTILLLWGNGSDLTTAAKEFNEAAKGYGLTGEEYFRVCTEQSFVLTESEDEKWTAEDDIEDHYEAFHNVNSSDEVMQILEARFPRQYVIISKRIALFEKNLRNIDADSQKFLRDIGQTYLDLMVTTSKGTAISLWKEYADAMREIRSNYSALPATSRNALEKTFCFKTTLIKLEELEKDMRRMLNLYDFDDDWNSYSIPEYKLYYFAFRGLAEVSRQLFALAGVEYENVGLTKEEWVEFKKKTPFGRIPVLEVDGKLIAQSLTIARYIASQHGLAGASPIESAWADSIADEWRDFHGNFKKYWYLKIGVRPGDIEGTRVEYGIPARDKFFPLIVKQLRETGSGFLVGNSVTWVDVLIANTVNEVEEKEPGFLADYPEVVQHQKRIYAIPALKKWIETRPQ